MLKYHPWTVLLQPPVMASSTAQPIHRHCFYGRVSEQQDHIISTIFLQTSPQRLTLVKQDIVLSTVLNWYSSTKAGVLELQSVLSELST